jgi:hypothetical protein
LSYQQLRGFAAETVGGASSGMVVAVLSGVGLKFKLSPNGVQAAVKSQMP